MAMRALFDVNFLIALFDPDHEFHEAAHHWWQLHQQKGWASCPMTENGLIRVLSSPGYSKKTRFSCSQVLQDLNFFVSGTNHEFWPDDVSLRDAAHLLPIHVQGPKQLTDLYLLALAVSKEGRLVTFDEHLPLHAVPNAKAEHCIVVPK
jgi:toxin-antitoxin system PIN domain toxin